MEFFIVAVTTIAAIVGKKALEKTGELLGTALVQWDLRLTLLNPYSWMLLQELTNGFSKGTSQAHSFSIIHNISCQINPVKPFLRNFYRS
ncbi:hypothetical protein PCC8801_1577 [Rippkaea orientalis PCC 8801]|uniref:Uncharacterized protein n=1 Tax=Rippkaea orientalis (strain PCC 8801 / RF-1) TaxID=41431 RepID=B7JUT5_RIPO1|nr:hypothetical protein [Rippkaea orientalis]ACK65629.1 hypothetical protein PCC8801_1577 [Rippkaea orientalis PCC 8801]